MSARFFSIVLLFLFAACAAPASKPVPSRQVAIPIVEPLVVPEPVVLPVPMALPPMAPFVVLPDGEAARPKPGTQTPSGTAKPAPPPEKAAEEPKEATAGNKSPPSNRTPPIPATWKEHPECQPRWKKHRGGNTVHNTCADTFPPNRMPGYDALVNGKFFDALQVGKPVLWEIKTERYDTYTPFVKKVVILDEVPKLRWERQLAEACGYEFVVGVSSPEHRDRLLKEIPDLHIVIIDC